MKIGYIMSRFPKITETFILREMLEARRQGISISIYPLILQKENVTHRDVRDLMSDVQYTAFLSLAVLLANLKYLLWHPICYLSVLGILIVETFGSLGMLLKTVGLFPKCVCIADRMQRDGITHVHAHFATFPATAALVVNRLTDIPFSFTAHGSDIHVKKHRRGLETKIQACEFAVMISEYNREFVQQNCDRPVSDKLVVVLCGIHPSEYATEGVPSSPADQPFTIACVAAFRPVKGHRYLIDACGQLESRGVDYVCHLVGDGPKRPEIERQIEELNLWERFVIHGMVPQEDVVGILKESDVFVLPSILTERGDREGLPVALMEAMATGLPVVVSEISGIPELVDGESTGLLVPCQDAEATAEALQRIEENPTLRRELGENAREKVREECDLEANVRRLIELWRDGLPGVKKVG